MKNCSRQRGSLLIEVIIVTVIFGIIGTGLLATLATSSVSAKQGVEYVVASGYIKEGIEAARSLRDQDWGLITNGTHGLSTGSGYYEFSGTSDALDAGTYTRTITIEDVYRTSSLTGDIGTTGVLDNNTKKVTVNVAWDVIDGRPQNIDAIFYLTNWAILAWTQTLLTEFEAGNRNSTVVTNTSGGEVTLEATENDWSGTETVFELDLSGGGDIISMAMNESTDQLYTLAESTGGDDINLIDISDVSDVSPTVLVGYDADNCFDIDVYAGHVYVACNESSVGAEVLILDAQTLTSVATIDLAGSFDTTAIRAEEDTLVIGQEEDATIDELHIYDISSPSSPSLLGVTDVGQSINDIGMNASFVYLVTNNNSEEVITVRLSDYVIVDTLDMSGSDNANTIDVRGDNIYVGRDDGADYDLALLDGSDPVTAGLSVTSSLEVSHNINDVNVSPSEDWIGLATNDNNEELVIVELSGFTVEETGDTTGSDNARSIIMMGRYAYIGSESNSEEVSILAVNANGWASPTLVGSVNKTGNHDAEEVVVVGNRTYLATQQSGSDDELFVYDTTNPATPTLLGSFDVNQQINGMVISGNYAYLATNSNSREVDIIDIGTPSSMSRVGSYNASGNANMFGVAISGSTLYAVRDSSSQPEIYVIDVTVPASPALLGSLGFSGGDVNDVVTDGSYLYIATDGNTSELSVIDVTIPATPTLSTSTNLSGNNNAETIAINGSMVAVGRAGGNELAILDISTPTSPSITSETSVTGGIYGIDFDGTDAVLLATTGSSVQMQRWDITTPSSPVLEGSYNLTSDGNGVAVSGSYVYYATSSNSLELQILGEGSGPSDYATEGTVTSQAFDSGSSSTSWNSIEWTSSGTGGVELMIRTADTEANLEDAQWVGSDGTSETTYATSGGGITVDSGAAGTQWIQWKGLLSGNGTSTPALEDVTLNY